MVIWTLRKGSPSHTEKFHFWEVIFREALFGHSVAMDLTSCSSSMSSNPILPLPSLLTSWSILRNGQLLVSFWGWYKDLTALYDNHFPLLLNNQRNFQRRPFEVQKVSVCYVPDFSESKYISNRQRILLFSCGSEVLQLFCAGLNNHSYKLLPH